MAGLRIGLIKLFTSECCDMWDSVFIFKNNKNYYNETGPYILYVAIYKFGDHL